MVVLSHSPRQRRAALLSSLHDPPSVRVQLSTELSEPEQLRERREEEFDVRSSNDADSGTAPDDIHAKYSKIMKIVHITCVELYVQ